MKKSVKELLGKVWANGEKKSVPTYYKTKG